MTEKQDKIDETVNSIAKKTGLRAIDVLREVMVYHHEKAQDTILGIIVLLKKETPPRGDLITHMHKEYERARDIAIDCANKLAPYESAKLQSMEVKSETVHKFVVRTPIQSQTTEEWMKMTGATYNKPKEIEVIHRVPSSRDNVEDVEEIFEDDEITSSDPVFGGSQEALLEEFKNKDF